jgi:hypothetical protein
MSNSELDTQSSAVNDSQRLPFLTLSLPLVLAFIVADMGGEFIRAKMTSQIWLWVAAILAGISLPFVFPNWLRRQQTTIAWDGSRLLLIAFYTYIRLTQISGN